MRLLTHRLAGSPLPIHFYEDDTDLDAFMEWLGRDRPVLAFDTETTGLDVFATSFACRLVQFGDQHGAWVVPARFREPIERALYGARKLVAHNATYDLLVIDQFFGIPLEDVAPKTINTSILAHIIDPREPQDGGIGLALKELARHWVDESAPDGDKELRAVFAENKWKREEGWRQIPETHDAYIRYSGLDTIITARLYGALLPHLAGFERLSRFEHSIMRLLARMERRGILLDVEYTEKLQHEMALEIEENTETIVRMVRQLGVAPLTDKGKKAVLDVINASLGGVPPKRRATSAGLYGKVSADSRAVIAQALLLMGEELTGTTATGQVSVDSTVLNELCDVNKDGERLDLREPNPLAVAVKAAKRATKWKSSYVDSMLEIRDRYDRVHPRIHGLKARTARMSISAPPLQQIPSSDRMIRDCFIADPGQLIVAADYSQIEMRLLAAMAQEPQMIAAIKGGVDLHDMTATILFGTDFTKKQRKLAKVAGFGRVYGGGAAVIAKQTGVSPEQARDVNTAYDESFPGIKKYGYRLQDMAQRSGSFSITTPLFGRRLPVDEDRIYAATNYSIQSTARDVFAQALLNLSDAGLEDYLLLPVHDEVIAQAPAEDAKEIAQMIGEVMSTEFEGVPLDAEGEVYGPRWGDGYG